MPKAILTQKLLKEILEYNKDTGVFIWKKTNNPRIKIGNVAGHLHSEGYIHIRIYGNGYRSHRLAFLYMTGDIPKEVDHKNHDRSDNRWVNLSASTTKLNSKNRSLNKNNTSGFNGVFYIKKSKQWSARIDSDNVTHYIGVFSSLDDAIQARKKADIKYGFHENHGN